ncbi:MAG: hypothetical protein ACJ75B_00745 [Flavisolibacter sp.]
MKKLMVSHFHVREDGNGERSMVNGESESSGTASVEGRWERVAFGQYRIPR